MNGSDGRGRLFRVDRDALNPIAGMKFGASLLVAAGLSALLGLDLLVVWSSVRIRNNPCLTRSNVPSE